MNFPYGVRDFAKLIRNGHVYIDRTDRIPLLEDAGYELTFLRPRRFGKSLLLAMLENYYDVAKGEQFEQIFGNLAIGRNPTPLHNQYFVMKWDFSKIEPQGSIQEIRKSLHDYINNRIRHFKVYYRDYLNYDIQVHESNALSSLESLLTAIQTTDHQLYLLIDEYDNFANEVMISQDAVSDERYESLTQGEGMLKTVFKNVKGAGAGEGLDRLFVTGISPVVMSDVTSGYNVSENIYLEPEFDDLCGFREEEIVPYLSRVIEECGLPSSQIDEALMLMRSFYDGYAFSHESEGRIYNPTLVFYFLKYLQRRCRYPDEMLDENLAMDQARIDYIARMSRGPSFIWKAINTQQPLVIPRLSRRFGLKQMLYEKKDDSFLGSLLFYFGILTLSGLTATRQVGLRIPNQVVRGLYVERIQRLLLPDLTDQDRGRQVGETLFLTGDLQPLCDFMEQRYFRVFDNRDYLHHDEFALKTMFLTLLFNDLLYIIDSEAELDRSYADLLLMRRPEMRKHPQLLDLLFEFKYVSLGDINQKRKARERLSGDDIRQMDIAELRELKSVQDERDTAVRQLHRYRATLAQKYGDILRLHCYSVVAVGFERLIWQEVNV